MTISIKKIMGIERNSIRKLNGLQLSEELFCNSLLSDENLVSYFRLEGNSNDYKGTNNGTDTAITYNAANGKFGQGAGFGGSTSKIVLTNSASLKPTSAFTVGCWTKTSYAPGVGSYFPSLFQNYFGTYGVVNLSGWRLSLSPETYPTFGVYPNTGNATGATASLKTSIADGLWHFIVGTVDGTYVKLYIDGVLVATTTSSLLPVYAATTYPRIGCYNGAGTDTYFFNGAIDDEFIFNRALNATEIASLYSAQIKKFMGVNNV